MQARQFIYLKVDIVTP